MAESLSIRFLGDIKKGRTLVGFAKQSLDAMKNIMLLGGLNTHTMKKCFDDGSEVTLSVTHGISIIYVYCPVIQHKVVSKLVEQQIDLLDTLIILVADNDTKFEVGYSNGSLDDSITTSEFDEIELSPDYYAHPYYDLLRENCLCITKLDDKNLVTTAPDNVNLMPRDKWDDWHYHRTYYVGMPQGLSVSDDIFRPPGRDGASVGDKIHFSMVDFTAGYGHMITSRYVDQFKRNYFPYSNMVKDDNGEYTELLLTAAMLRYYGKSANGESVEYLSQVLLSPNIDTVQFFWPFIPYMDEVGHFHLLNYGRNDSVYRMSVLNPALANLYVWNLFSDSAVFTNGEYVRTYNYPISITDWYSYCGYGTETIDEVEGAYSSSGIKHTPIAPIGKEKACYVKTSWQINGAGPVMNKVMNTVTDGNYPIHYLIGGGSIGDGNIAPGTYKNESTTEGEWTEHASNEIHITQQLMFGDDVVATGSSTMTYSMTRNGSYAYAGFMESILVGQPPCECGGESINYVTAQMSVGDSQSLSVSDAQTGCSYTWELSSGGGSLSTEVGPNTTYTAPSQNENCVDNPTITLSCDGGVIDYVTMAVTDPNIGVEWAGFLPDHCERQRVLGSCHGQYAGNPFRCNGQLGSGTYCTGMQAECSVEEAQAIIDTLCEQSLISCQELDQRTAEQLENGCCPQQLL